MRAQPEPLSLEILGSSHLSRPSGSGFALSKAVVVLVALLLLPTNALAEEVQTARTSKHEPAAKIPPEEEIHFKPAPLPSNFRRFTWVDAGLTVAMTGVSIGARIVGPREDGWRGGVWFDEAARDALRASSYSGRLAASDTSDVLLGLSVAWAMLGDPVVNAAWLRQSPDTAGQLALINAEVLGFTLGIQQLTANIVGRERPYGRTCGTDDLDEDNRYCWGPDRYRSYFSGHTSVPFAMAAATCVHHSRLPLSNGHAWIPCLTGFTMAAATGVLRIVGDYHYATDVMTGAAVGTAIGALIPLWHYRFRKAPLSGEVAGTSFQVMPMGLGLQVRGVMQ